MLFGLEFIPAFIKIGFNVAFAIVTSIPFYFAWNCVAPKYFGNYLPQQFHHIPFWEMVALLLVFTFVGEQINKLTPKFISVNNSNSNK